VTSFAERFARESRRLGYRSEAIITNYKFQDFGAAANRTCTADLAVFSQTPASYRSAAFAVVKADPLVSAAEVVSARRALGAPLFFVVTGEEVSAWQVRAEGAPRLLLKSNLEHLSNLFDAKRDEWAPEKIHRAKSIGKFNSAYQLDFIDIGLLPAIEGQIHKKLDRLLNDSLSVITDTGESVRKDIFRGVFRLLAAKILADRKHSAAAQWRGADVAGILTAVDHFYGLHGPRINTRVLGRKLEPVWSKIDSSVNFSNISADDLAFLYEHTLVTTETRKKYGTHSTPRAVAEYMVNRLGLGLDSNDVGKVYEPFSGAGVFLVAALRHIRDALPVDWSDNQRHDFLVKKISGSEIDAFACEACTLSLILADYPNKNGWEIRNEDLLSDGVLQRRLVDARVVLCNPPYEVLSPDQQGKYGQIAALSNAKGEAVLQATLQAKPDAIGFVLPRTLILDKAYSRQRRLIEQTYREVELVSLPDNIFAVSKIESALLIARNPGRAGERQMVRSTEVKDHERSSFLTGEVPTDTRSEVRKLPILAEDKLWISSLQAIWRRFESLPTLGDFFHAHWGIRWKEKRQSNAAASTPNVKRRKGILNSTGLAQFHLPRASWLDFDPEHLYGGGELPWDDAKVMMNAGRLGRGYWRNAACVDASGLVASQQYVVLWPHAGCDFDLHVVAAILNGPVANAFMTEHSTEKRIRIKTLLSLPIPRRIPAGLAPLVREYASLVLQPSLLGEYEGRLAHLLASIDVAILEAYNLPPKLERALLAAFQGANRRTAHSWTEWSVDPSGPAYSLGELYSGLDRLNTGNWIHRELQPLPREEAEVLRRHLP